MCIHTHTHLFILFILNISNYLILSKKKKKRRYGKYREEKGMKHCLLLRPFFKWYYYSWNCQLGSSMVVTEQQVIIYKPQTQAYSSKNEHRSEKKQQQRYE